MSDFRVSDHCLVRYMERVLNLDLDSIRKEITDKVEGPALAGARRVNDGGLIFEIANRVVVTITLGKDSPGFKRSPPNKHVSNRGEAFDPDRHQRQKRLARAGGLLR